MTNLEIARETFAILGERTLVCGSDRPLHATPEDWTSLNDCLDLYVEHEIAARTVSPYVWIDDDARGEKGFQTLVFNREYAYHVAAGSALRRVVMPL